MESVQEEVVPKAFFNLTGTLWAGPGWTDQTTLVRPSRYTLPPAQPTTVEEEARPEEEDPSNIPELLETTDVPDLVENEEEEEEEEYVPVDCLVAIL